MIRHHADAASLDDGQVLVGRDDGLPMVPSLWARLRAVAAEVEADTVNLSTELELVQLALVGRFHLFFRSVPGLGKSYLIDRFLLYITGASVFHYQMSAASPEHDLLGIVSVKAFKEDRLARVFKGFLPDAEIAVLDEGFEAGPPVLNALRQMLNEGTIRQDGETVAVPLSTCVIASNKMPREELDGFFDRFMLRRIVAPVTEPADMLRLLDVDPDPSPAPLITWAEIVAAQAEVAAMPVTAEAKLAIVAAVATLRSEHGIETSGRRLVACQDVVRAKAWLDGAAEAGVEHLEPLVHVLWRKPEEVAIVERVVLTAMAPGMSPVLDLSDTALDIADKLRTANALKVTDPARARLAVETVDHLKRAAREALKLRKSSDGRAADTLASVEARLEATHAEVYATVMKLTTDVPPLFKRKAA